MSTLYACLTVGDPPLRTIEQVRNRRAIGGGPRPSVNPWRHAYVRAKHFRAAALRLDALGEAVWDRDCNPDGSLRLTVSRWCAWLWVPCGVYHEAATRADWGCR